MTTASSSNYGHFGISSNDRQPEMAAETGNTYIIEIVRNVIKIPKANLGFTTTESSLKVSASDCNNTDR